VGVGGRIGDHFRDLSGKVLDHRDACLRVVGVAVGEGLRDDHAVGVHTQTPRLLASFLTPAVLRCGPRALADNRNAGAVEDETHRAPRRWTLQWQLQVTSASRACRVIGSVDVYADEFEERA
jgi:hypothetical protein